MRASAPGKVVLSGAYSVLRGAPALVAAVDRRVEADTERPPEFIAPEVTEGFAGLGLPATTRAPYFDAARLREEGRKLGLGSSAGICVASLGALLAKNDSTQRGALLIQTLYPHALTAHRKAQGGGSGIDIAAACFGGVLEAHLSVDAEGQRQLAVSPSPLPPDLAVETWASPQAASTADFVKKVFSRESEPACASALSAQKNSATRALEANKEGSRDALIAALRGQFSALCALGDSCELPIVLPEIRKLHHGLPQDCCFLPSGAGGGDITLFFGPAPSSNPFRKAAEECGLKEVQLSLGAPGLTLHDE